MKQLLTLVLFFIAVQSWSQTVYKSYDSYPLYPGNPATVKLLGAKDGRPYNVLVSALLDSTFKLSDTATFAQRLRTWVAAQSFGSVTDLIQLNDSTLRFTNGTGNKDFVFPAPDTTTDATGLATRFQNGKKVDTTAFQNPTSSYFVAGSQTSPNLNTNYNMSEGSVAQISGDVLFNVFNLAYTRAEYSATGVIGGRISYTGGKTWDTVRVIKAVAGRPVRNPILGNVGGTTIGMVYKLGSPAPYDTINGLSSILQSDTLFYTSSADSGNTWSTPVVIKSSTPGRSLIGSGNIKRAKDGSLRFTGWNNNLCEVYVSNNSGAAWSTLSTVYSPTTVSAIDATWNLTEPSLVELGNSKMRIITRNNITADGDTRYPCFFSNDNGVTWAPQGLLNLPTFNIWKYRSTPAQISDTTEGKLYTIFGTRSQSSTNGTGYADSLYIAQDDIASVISNPLTITIKWKVERPVPNTFYHKSMAAVAKTPTGYAIVFTESTPDGSFTGALQYALYHLNLFKVNNNYNLKDIIPYYSGVGPVYNVITKNYDFVKAPSTSINTASDGTKYLYVPKGLVISGLNYGVKYLDYANPSIPGGFAEYAQTAVPGPTNYFRRIDQSGNIHYNAPSGANSTFRYSGNIAAQIYPNGNWQFGNASTTFSDNGHGFHVSRDFYSDTLGQFNANVGIGAAPFGMSSYGRGLYIFNNNPTVGILGNASTRLESVYSSTFDYRRIPNTGFVFYRVQDLTDATISEFKFNGTGSIDMKSGSGGSGGQFNFYINNAARYAFTPTGLNLANTGSPTTSLQLPSGTAADGTAPIKFAVTNPVLMTNPSKFAGEVDSLNFYYTNGGTVRYTIAKTLTNTVTIDFPSTAAGTSSEVTFTLTGVAAGDIIDITATDGSSIANGMINARGTGPNQGTAKYLNASASTIDPASNTYRVAAIIYH